MRKILLSMIICLFLITGVSYAEDTTSFQWFTTGITTEVDAHYFLNKELSGKFGGGIAVEFAQLFDNTVGLRGELVIPDKPDDMVAPDKLGGIGATLKLHNVINKLNGSTIIPDKVQIGISALIDVTHGLAYNDLRNPYLSLMTVGIKFQ